MQDDWVDRRRGDRHPRPNETGAAAPQEPHRLHRQDNGGPEDTRHCKVGFRNFRNFAFERFASGCMPLRNAE